MTLISHNLAEKKISHPVKKHYKNGMVVEDTVIGDGNAVRAGDYVSIHYTGTTESGKEFDSSYKRCQPLTIRVGVGDLTHCWDVGILGMREGGTRKISVIANQWGGCLGPGISKTDTLTFEIELITRHDW